MFNFELFKLSTYADQRGSLTVLNNRLPFDVRRVYWIYGADGMVRGGHRHHKTRQALVALAGSISVFIDDGDVQSTVNLNEPDLCLLVEPKDWHRMSFGPGSVLLVFASHDYDPSDYIHARYE